MEFRSHVFSLAEYLNCDVKEEHITKLYKTIIDETYHPAFQIEEYRSIAITFHSSKGLEFDQVLIFADDYILNDESSIYNHYVATTRAKNRLIIIYTPYLG